MPAQRYERTAAERAQRSAGAQRGPLYLGEMGDSERAARPPQSSGGAGGSEPGQSPSPAPAEDAQATRGRYGPLLIERTRKEDGRALIYYSLAERSP